MKTLIMIKNFILNLLLRINKNTSLSNVNINLLNCYIIFTIYHLIFNDYLFIEKNSVSSCLTQLEETGTIDKLKKFTF